MAWASGEKAAADAGAEQRAKHLGSPFTAVAEDHGALNVRRHGAIGDGVADDTAGLQSALAVAGARTVVIPPGQYRVTRPLRAQSGLTLVAPGAALVTDQTDIETMLSLDNLSSVRIFGLAFVSNGTFRQQPFRFSASTGYRVGYSNTTSGIVVRNGCSAVSITECEFRGIEVGVSASRGEAEYSCTDFSLSGCRFTSVGRGGARLKHLHRFHVRDNIVSGVLGACTKDGTDPDECGMGDGLLFFAPKRGAITRNHIEDVIRIGIVVEWDYRSRAPEDVLVEGNRIFNAHSSRRIHGEQNYNGGIWIEAKYGAEQECRSIIVANNIVDNFGAGPGLRGYNDSVGIRTQNAIAIGNSISNCHTGMLIAGHTNSVEITSNSIRGNSFGIASYCRHPRVIISANRLHDNARTGFLMRDAKDALISLTNNQFIDNGESASGPGGAIDVSAIPAGSVADFRGNIILLQRLSGDPRSQVRWPGSPDAVDGYNSFGQFR